MSRWISGLHFARFGGITVRILFFVLALGTCATILTGNWIWLARREDRRERLGNRMLARLTVGFGAGTLVAIAALFLASRVFPLDLLGRTKAEELTFIVVLGRSATRSRSRSGSRRCALHFWPAAQRGCGWSAPCSASCSARSRTAFRDERGVVAATMPKAPPPARLTPRRPAERR